MGHMLVVKLIFSTPLSQCICMVGVGAVMFSLSRTLFQVEPPIRTHMMTYPLAVPFAVSPGDGTNNPVPQ
jgi:hypothetical protein